MSGIYIEGMEMPEKCIDCNLFELPYSWCRALEDETMSPFTRRESDCPLVPVPEHGRLIDADAFIKQKTEQICENCDRRRGMKDGKLTKRFVYAIGDAPCRACDIGDMLDYVDDAPTIIPADLEKGET